MGIKTGVSLYSFQQAEFFGKVTWKDELRWLAENGIKGVEIISETTIIDYPMPPEQFYFEWNNEIARYDLEPVTMDCYLDPLQFRDHVMNYREAAERIKYDLRIAKRMGFKNIRLVHNVPWDVVELALPTAEELGVRMTNEIHAPASIKPKLGTNWGDTVANDIAFIQRTGTKFYGLQPDMGIFQDKPSKPAVGYMLRSAGVKDWSPLADELIAAASESKDPEAFAAYVKGKVPNINTRFLGMLTRGPSAQPEDLYEIIPYIFCIHGKFYDMTEIPGCPGQYEEKSIMYEKAISVLKWGGYNGYINSEFEGQRHQQDMGKEGLVDEFEQVRRHHEMLNRLINMPFKAQIG